VADADRRRYRRIQAPVFIRPVGPLSRMRAHQVSNISLGGLRAFSDDKHKTGERLELELFLPDKSTVTVVAEVVWVQQLPDGSPARFDVGLRYVDVGPEELERLAQVLSDE
jgi:hypothetical protein